jgi:hypothetical protein
MKPILRIAAALSFLSFFIGGCRILNAALSSPGRDSWAIVAVGLFFVGTAFFVGPMLFVAAEKCGRKDGQG